MTSFKTAVALVALGCTLGACDQKLAPAAASSSATVSQADADKIADATVAAWTSMDAARIKALYAPGVVGFDFTTPALVTDRATWDRNQDGFAAAKLNMAEAKERRVQPLDADTFVLSGRWMLTSKAVPKNDTMVRCTDVFHKDDAGNWPIVNEHCSADPRPA